ncbi:MAG: AraC family transcriptional regulator [Cyanobacteria bacterium P01_G01_bin.49]
MTIRLTADEFHELFQEADQEERQFDVSDELDITNQSNGQYFEGWMRRIQLRGGIFILIERSQNRERLLLNYPEGKRLLKWHFILSGQQHSIHSFSHKETCFSLSAGRHVVYGSGLTKSIENCSDAEPFLEVTIGMQPKVLRSFVSDSSEELPKVFNHLVRPFDRQCYLRDGQTPPMINAILQQILQCPYQGLTKRMYLEGKAAELMALMLEEEAAFQQGEFQTCLLQPDQLDRIHYAKEIILKNLTNPPSLMELARQVGVCDYNLKRGFKEVFGTTVFGYLRDRRLERASALLLEQKMTVAQVASVIGYGSPTSFNAAFKRKYGMSPKTYQISVRK